MKNIFLVSTFFIIIIFHLACVPNTETLNSNINISYADTEIQNILNLQDKQDVNGLYKYFRNENPSYRYLAVLAFASIKDQTTCDSLIKMLQDPVLEISGAAAYALGQIGNIKITDRLIASFKGRDSLKVDNIFNANVLEAVGKIGNESDLIAIATIKTYRNTDTLLLLGQARAIYRMAVRNITNDAGTSRMVDLLYLNSSPEEVKLMAANYLGRSKDIGLSLYKVRLTEIFGRTQDPNISMALATAFGKTKDIDFLPSLKAKLISEPDYRVKCNIIRAFANFPYVDIRDITLNNLRNENIHISSTAADVIQSNGIMEDVPEYMRYDTITLPWQVRSKMNGAVLTHTALYFTKSKTAFSEKIINNLKQSTSIYSKSAYVTALSRDPFNYLVLSQLYDDEKEPLVKITALEGLGNILKNPLFFRAFGNGYGRVKAEILNKLVAGIGSKDVGQIATASNILKDASLGWKEWIRDYAFMREALSKLTLPRDIEAYNELKSCMNFLEGKEYKPEKVAYNHPIDFSILATVADSSFVAIKTSLGIIRVQLNKSIAPATVANFVSLINEKYYTGKVFHRVVPNFVIQTGCPRGDGYGSLDYTIRSELPQVYYDKEGFIGMASAGNHTESTQWFITHSPTPHLDGNYTIFGKVIEGMDVVHKIQVGDKINEIIFVR
jgi:cyclophilin family peptidyl-prolyl cis-trans isomerase